MSDVRKLASVQEIAEKKAIEGADAIEAVRVNGWWVVAKKNEFEVGDKCIYFEIDSFLPVIDTFEFLRKSCFKSTQHLGDGFRLKTIRLRGQISQGLVIPVSHLDKIGYRGSLELGTDLTKILMVKKYEAPIPAQLAGQVEGAFPSFIPKTDQERCQNLVAEIKKAYDDSETFEVTIKLDGSSTTVFYNNEETGVCSRNLHLKDNEANSRNTFIRVAHDTGLIDALNKMKINIAVQGEVMGPGVQGNREKLEKPDLFIFDIYDINQGRYLFPSERMAMLDSLRSYGYRGQHVPVFETRTFLQTHEIDKLLKMAEGPSLKHDIREGLVFKSHTTDFSFKVISNQFLLKGGE